MVIESVFYFCDFTNRINKMNLIFSEEETPKISSGFIHTDLVSKISDYDEKYFLTGADDHTLRLISKNTCST